MTQAAFQKVDNPTPKVVSAGQTGPAVEFGRRAVFKNFPTIKSDFDAIVESYEADESLRLTVFTRDQALQKERADVLTRIERLKAAIARSGPQYRETNEGGKIVRVPVDAFESLNEELADVEAKLAKNGKLEKSIRATPVPMLTTFIDDLSQRSGVKIVNKDDHKTKQNLPVIEKELRELFNAHKLNSSAIGTDDDIAQAIKNGFRESAERLDPFEMFGNVAAGGSFVAPEKQTALARVMVEDKSGFGFSMQDNMFALFGLMGDENPLLPVLTKRAIEYVHDMMIPQMGAAEKAEALKGIESKIVATWRKFEWVVRQEEGNGKRPFRWRAPEQSALADRLQRIAPKILLWIE